MKIWITMVMLVGTMVITGCTIEEAKPQKLKDMEFTVVEDAALPEALQTVIEEKKQEPFQISYTLGEELYIAIGYGEQGTGGYSIQVNECYETETSIYMDTTLLGPQTQEEITEMPTWPYIVIKTASVPDKPIEFH